MHQIRGWRGQDIVGARSRSSGDFWARDWRDLVLDTTGAIENKARERAGRAGSWFDAEAFELLRTVDSGCCYLQSIKSEDTVTWAAFGPRVGNAALNSGLDRAFGSASRPQEWNRSLWRRWPHPETGKAQNGPEPDAVLINAPWCYVVEAKWLADLDDTQGSDGGLGQMILRAEIAKSEGPDPLRRGVLIVVPGPSRYPHARAGAFANYFEVSGESYRPRARAAELGAGIVTWEELIDAIEAAQGSCEVVDYLRWRLAAIDNPP